MKPLYAWYSEAYSPEPNWDGKYTRSIFVGKGYYKDILADLYLRAPHDGEFVASVVYSNRPGDYECVRCENFYLFLNALAQGIGENK